MYPVVNELTQLWNVFENEIRNHPLDDSKLSVIKKLMTAESVIDLSAHEIYPQAVGVHELTVMLLKLKSDHPGDASIEQCCQHWLDMLRLRNQHPLKLRHHQRLDGECDFRFSLQLMEGKPSGFKEIQILHHQKDAALDETVKAMHRLGLMAHGHSFGGLPLMKNTVLTSLMEFPDVMCLVAKDQSDQVIGYSWGLMLRDVEVGKKQKANIFWLMDLARDADFHDDNVKVGELLRERIVNELKLRHDCDFVGYQHILNHKFHMGIVNQAQNEDEELHLDNDAHAAQAARTTVTYSDNTGLYMRAHFIKASERDVAYPEYKSITPAIISAFQRSSHSMKDFIVGALAFMGQQKYLQMTHKLMHEPAAHRISAPIKPEQQICDADVLKQIILNDSWAQQGASLFSRNHTPDTISKLQAIVAGDGYDFAAIKLCAASRGKCVTRKANAKILYEAIDVADSPSFVLDELLSNSKTPLDWVQMISNNRHAAMQLEVRGAEHKK